MQGCAAGTIVVACGSEQEEDSTATAQADRQEQGRRRRRRREGLGIMATAAALVVSSSSLSATPSSSQVSETIATAWSVQQWLRALQLDRHFEAFVDNGYDELDVCQHIGLADLAAIGVTDDTETNILLEAAQGLRAHIQLQQQQASAATLAPIYFTLEETAQQGETEEGEMLEQQQQLEARNTQRPNGPGSRSPASRDTKSHQRSSSSSRQHHTVRFVSLHYLLIIKSDEIIW